VDESSRTRTAGVGIQFYGLGTDAREKWAELISHVRQTCPEAEIGAANLCQGTAIEPLVRRDATHVKTLRIVAERLPDLVALQQRASDEREVFIMSNTQLFVDDPIGLEVVHPHSEDVFELSAKVVRCVRDGDVMGFKAKLLKFDEERAKRFEEFVFDALTPMFDDEDSSGVVPVIEQE
jgi:hypothetical protein